MSCFWKSLGLLNLTGMTNTTQGKLVFTELRLPVLLVLHQWSGDIVCSERLGFNPRWAGWAWRPTILRPRCGASGPCRFGMTSIFESGTDCAPGAEAGVHALVYEVSKPYTRVNFHRFSESSSPWIGVHHILLCLVMWNILELYPRTPPLPCPFAPEKGEFALAGHSLGVC